MIERRRFIRIVPAVAAAGSLAPLLAACGDKASAPAPAPAAPAPAAPATPAPVAAAPSPAAASAPGVPPAAADALPMLSESNPMAVSLGYVASASRVDRAVRTSYQPGQACAGCALFQGPPTATAAPCPMFAGHRVSGEGWCTAWTKRA